MSYGEGRFAFPFHHRDPQLNYANLTRLIPERFTSLVAPYDPELAQVWEAHIIYTTEDVVKRLELDNWVAIANSTSLPLGKSWLEMGFFDRKAIVQAVNKFNSEREKKTQEKTNQLKQELADRTPHRSVFQDLGIPKIP